MGEKAEPSGAAEEAIRTDGAAAPGTPLGAGLSVFLHPHGVVLSSWPTADFKASVQTLPRTYRAKLALVIRGSRKATVAALCTQYNARYQLTSVEGLRQQLRSFFSWQWQIGSFHFLLWAFLYFSYKWQ